MSIERCVVSGTIAGVVQTRTMFTCDVVPQGGDTTAILWGAYLVSLYDELENLLSDLWVGYAIERQTWTNGHWVPYAQSAFDKHGVNTGDALPNAVSTVLLGKGGGLRQVGRKFIGPLPKSLTTGNSLTTTAAITAAAALLAYITPFTGIGGGTITPGILNKDGYFAPFVGGVVSSLLGSMRRRKPGLGI